MGKMIMRLPLGHLLMERFLMVLFGCTIVFLKANSVLLILFLWGLSFYC